MTSINFRLLILFSALSSLVSMITGCSTRTYQLPLPNTFPDRKVVFQANDGYKYALGFMNDDGSGVVIEPTGDFRISLPMWSEDKQTIYFVRIPPMPGDAEDLSSGSVGYLRNGKNIVSVCPNSDVSWAIYPLPQNDIGISKYIGSSMLGFYNISKCNSVKILVDISNDKVTRHIIDSLNVSKDRRYIIYSEPNDDIGDLNQNDLKIYDVMTGNITKVGEGFSPSISSDDHQIAFFRLDGIYVMDFSGKNVHRLVSFGSSVNEFYFSIRPIPYWSSDNQWLIYHKCTASDSAECHFGHSFSIFKLQVSTGKEVKLYDGGLYPNW